MKNLRHLIPILAFFQATWLPAFGQEEIPFGEPPDPSPLPGDAIIRQVLAKPPSGGWTPASQPQSPSTQTNFLAFGDDGFTGGVPPDVQGAVGPSNVMIMLNTYVRIQDRIGNTNSTVTLSNWWGFSGVTPFDPRVVYEPYSGRWIAVAAGNMRATTSVLLVGVSESSDPTGNWHRRSFDADPSHIRWVDFPMVGFNKDWIVVTANMYPTNNSANFHFAKLWVFNKTNLFAGGTNAPTILTNSAGAFTLAPSLVYDNSASNMHLLTTWTNTSLRVYAVTGAIGNEKLVATANFPSTTNSPWGTKAPPGGENFLLQPRTNSAFANIHAIDSRLAAPVIQRNGFLWVTHHIFLPIDDLCRTAVQWWQIEIPSFVPYNVGRIDDPNNVLSYAYPSIAVNRFNDVLVGYSRFASNQWAGANYSFRDTTELGDKLRLDTVLKSGEAFYWRIDSVSTLRNRWGDYTATVVDPVNDSDLWTLGEFARPLSAPIVNTSGRWGAWWGRIAPTLPGNDDFSNAYAITNAQGTTNGTVIRATRQTGEPNHGGFAQSPSVWFRWVAPANGDVTLNTTSGDVDSQLALAIYTGTIVSSLSLITNATGVNPLVVFNASSGTTYQIAVAGLNGASVDFPLQWTQPTAPMFVRHPEGTNVVVGESVTFQSLAVAAPNPTYFWKFRGTNSTDVTNSIAGANAASYTIASVQTSHPGSYWVVASNTSGFATSSVATLFVHGNSAARLSLLGASANQFFFHISGLTNRAYRIETSTNLASPTNWYPAFTNYVSYWYTNLNLSNSQYRFYRAITNE